MQAYRYNFVRYGCQSDLIAHRSAHIVVHSLPNNSEWEPWLKDLTLEQQSWNLFIERDGKGWLHVDRGHESTLCVEMRSVPYTFPITLLLVSSLMLAVYAKFRE